MKTFDEHKKRPRTFVEIVDENEKGLIKDLENLSINEETFSIDDITDAWDSIITEANFTDGTYCKIEIDENFDSDTENNGDHTIVEISFTGRIEVNDIYVDTIIETFMKELNSSDNNYDQERWTEGQIVDALDAVAWEDYIDIDNSDIEAEISNISEDGPSVTIEYQISENSYFISVDLKEMLNDFNNELTGR